MFMIFGLSRAEVMCPCGHDLLPVIQCLRRCGQRASNPSCLTVPIVCSRCLCVPLDERVP
jgi:hypothetical protein